MNFKPLIKKIANRAIDSHKYDFGKILLVGGNLTMPGAIILSALGALRSGAGVIHVATRKGHLPLLLANDPSFIIHEIETEEDLDDLYKKESFDAIGIGPGLGRDKWASLLYQKTISARVPLVIDADALFFMDQKIQSCVITPHWGEACRLTKVEKEAETTREEMVELLHHFSDVVLLKGHQTIISEKEKMQYVNQTGCSVLSCAGSGDVLTGVITSFLGQGLSLFEASSLASYLHGLAGDEIKSRDGVVGTSSKDIAFEIRRLINNIR